MKQTILCPSGKIARLMKEPDFVAECRSRGLGVSDMCSKEAIARKLCAFYQMILDSSHRKSVQSG